MKKTSQKLAAAGMVTPGQPGETVVVRLYRKSREKFRPLATRRPTLNTTGAYKAQFRRPNSGSCRIEVRFAGNNEVTPSAATKTFRC